MQASQLFGFQANLNIRRSREPERESGAHLVQTVDHQTKWGAVAVFGDQVQSLLGLTVEGQGGVLALPVLHVQAQQLLGHLHLLDVGQPVVTRPGDLQRNGVYEL